MNNTYLKYFTEKEAKENINANTSKHKHDEQEIFKSTYVVNKTWSDVFHEKILEKLTVTLLVITIYQ